MAHCAQPPCPVGLPLLYVCLGTGHKASWKKGASVFNKQDDKWGGVVQEEVQQVGTELNMVWYFSKELQQEKRKGRKAIVSGHSD